MDTVVVARQDQHVSVLGTEDDHWVDGLFVADVIRKFGIDPHFALTPDPRLQTPVGLPHLTKAYWKPTNNRISTDTRKQLQLKLTERVRKQAKARERGANPAYRNSSTLSSAPW